MHMLDCNFAIVKQLIFPLPLSKRTMKNNVSTIIAAGKRTMTEQRDADFYRACCRELTASEREGHLHPTVRSLVSATLQSRAPMFYVSYAFALRTLRGMRRHRSGRSYDSRRRKWHDIDLRVAALEHRHRLSDSEALQRVLAEGDAPGFYLSVSAAERIYRQWRRQRG